MARTLDVWLHGARVGALTQVDGRLSFVYAPDWVAGGHDAARALSQSLPVRVEPFDDRATRPFFAGLLPEGDKRRLVAKALQASEQNDFALLDGLGGECAGAVTLLEPGQVPQASGADGGTAAVRWLSEADLLALLTELPKRPLLAGEEGLRLSLAGAQDKLPVVWDGGQRRIGLPLDGSPSTHILKPAIPDVDGSVLNEAFCMRLAALLGLEVAPVLLHPVAGQAVLLLSRHQRT